MEKPLQCPSCHFLAVLVKKSIIWNLSGSLLQFLCDKCATYCTDNNGNTIYVCGYKYVFATLGGCFDPCQAACAI